MKRSKIAVAAIGSLLLLSAVGVAVAIPKLPAGEITEDKLRGWCNEQGGAFFGKDVDTHGSVYGCLLPDGTLVACGGVIPMCLTTRQRQAVDDLLGFKTIISAMDQQFEAVKKLEDKIKILEDRVGEMERSLKQR
jgi:hypothetical protein